MPYSRANNLRGTRRSTGTRRPRGRGTQSLKVRYQAPTARNQRAQIYRNTRLVSRLSRNQAYHRVWSDWQYTGSVPTVSNVWGIVRLTDFGQWNSVLRADAAVARKAHTFVKRCQLNLRYNLNDAAMMGVNIFVVTMRKFSTNVDPWGNPPVLGEDFIEPSMSNGFNVRLNSGIYKVHYAKYMSLTKNSLGSQPAAGENVGDPNTTWHKGQCNIRMNLSVTNPVARSGTADTWLEVPFDNLPYYGKYYIMCYPVWAFETGGSVDPFIGFDALFTTINSS